MALVFYQSSLLYCISYSEVFVDYLLNYCKIQETQNEVELHSLVLMVFTSLCPPGGSAPLLWPLKCLHWLFPLQLCLVMRNHDIYIASSAEWASALTETGVYKQVTGSEDCLLTGLTFYTLLFCPSRVPLIFIFYLFALDQYSILK